MLCNHQVVLASTSIIMQNPNNVNKTIIPSLLTTHQVSLMQSLLTHSVTLQMEEMERKVVSKYICSTRTESCVSIDCLTPHSLFIQNIRLALLITNIADITDMTRLSLLCIPCQSTGATTTTILQLFDIITEVSSTHYCTGLAILIIVCAGTSTTSTTFTGHD